MANTVTLYKTQLNRENRMFNKQELMLYLVRCSSVEIDTTYPIIPNVPFYCDITALAIAGTIYEYNYLSYTYNGITYYSFIDSISFMANEYQCRINHTTDYWIMSNVSQTTSVMPNRIAGRVTRALLEDYKDYNGSTYTPNLDYTFNTPEVQYNNAALIYNKYRPSLYSFNGKIGTYYAQYWLYIYIANPNTVKNTSDVISQGSMVRRDSTTYYDYGVGNLGVTLCYPFLLTYTGGLVCYIDTDGTLGVTALNNLTNTAITSMIISPLPPQDYNYYEYTEYTYLGFPILIPSEMISLVPLDTVEGLPPYLNYVKEISGIKYSLSMLYDDQTSSGKTLSSRESEFIRDNSTRTANDYLNDVPKAYSPIYNPIYVEDIPITYQALPNTVDTDFITVYLSADLTCYKYTINASTMQGFNSKVYTKQITSSFSPTVLQDYWTRLNASIESISARGAKTKSIVNGVSSVVSTLTSLGTSLSNTYFGNYGQISGDKSVAFAGRGLTSATNNLVNNGISTAGTLYDSYYNYQIADRQQEIADYQYWTGLTDENGALYLSGIFDFSDLPTVYTVRQPSENIRNISYQLATKGENCNLDFSAYWTNHVARQYYEYLEMTDVVVYNCNAEVQQNLKQMFANGVRLWYYNSDTDNIGNPYSVQNYPYIEEDED